MLLGITEKELHLKTCSIDLQDLSGVLAKIGTEEKLVFGGFISRRGDYRDDPQLSFEVGGIGNDGVDVDGLFFWGYSLLLHWLPA